MVVAAQKAVGEDCRLKGGRPPTPLHVIAEALFYRLRKQGPGGICRRSSVLGERSMDGTNALWEREFGRSCSKGTPVA